MTKHNYTPPAIEVAGSLHDLTKGGSVIVNELPNQPVNNIDAFPIAGPGPLS